MQALRRQADREDTRGLVAGSGIEAVRTTQNGQQERGESYGREA